MGQINERLETTLLKRHATEAVLLVSQELFFSRRYIVFLIIVSVFSLVCFGAEHLNFTNWILALLLLTGLWALPAILYLILRVRTLSRLKLSFNQPIKYELNNTRVSVWYGDQKREFLWSDFTKYIKSPEVTVLFSAGQKRFIFFPNTVLSEKTEAQILEAFNRGQTVPPVISTSAAAGQSRKKYLMAIMIIVILAIAFFLASHNHMTPLPSDLGK